ncbi:MAG: L-serine ammonia-lyase, iron-sulfur-dependent, subunit beta [Coriobacteriia bacterium]|nr:L-serine ammonia-lyase, iron-sulfur-dependent, subunit beta [Coriobacteriia bacterium]
MSRQRSIFDVVGPVMIGPSSSHTAGACRLGELARAILGSTPARVHVLLHGSFASTGRGHGTDLALIAGLLGMRPDDERIPHSFDVAAEQGLVFDFAFHELGDAHPNTAEFALTDAAGRQLSVRGSSLGGGDVVVTRVDDYDVEISGDLPVLVVGHQDRPGVIAAVTSMLAESNTNIATMQVSRERRGANALMLIATDAPVAAETVALIAAQPGVTSVQPVSAV